MPPLSLPKAPVEQGHKAPGPVASKPPGSSNGIPVALPAGLPAGPALSLPALPKLSPPARSQLKPPVADLMSHRSNSSHGSDGDDLMSAVSSVSKQIDMDKAPPKALRPPPSLDDSPFPAPVFCGPVDDRIANSDSANKPAALPKDLPVSVLELPMPPLASVKVSKPEQRVSEEEMIPNDAAKVSEAPSSVSATGDSELKPEVMTKEAAPESLAAAKLEPGSSQEPRRVHIAGPTEEAEDFVLQEFPDRSVQKTADQDVSEHESPVARAAASTPGPSASSVFFDP